MPQLFDHHTHSECSPDGNHPVLALATHAAASGLSVLAVTDHCDLGRQCQPDWEERLLRSLEEIQAAREAFDGQLTLLSGIELGQPLHDQALAEKILSTHRFDLVLGSIHNLNQTEDFYYLQDGGLDHAALLRCYFSELLLMTQWGGFDVLAHLTYPYRYFGYETTPPIQDFEEVLREIFCLLAHNGKALELNTSGLYRIKGGRAMPDLWELRLFRECGGELVTLGSDSHRAEQVGGGLQIGIELLKEAGFVYQTSFLERSANVHCL